MKFDFYDHTGEICPIPVIKVIKYYMNMNSGDEVQVLVDDPAAIKNIKDELEGKDIIIKVDSYGSSWKITMTKC
ncbi:MAG: hypothetical protein ACD_79C00937G0001 [uncultured bacterium]|nr:MAG: hypothetical protein ACD_79C00937G0001 [uncultured bacterium]